MNEKEKLSMKGYVSLGVIIVLAIVSILITQRLFTAEYPYPFRRLFYGNRMWHACDCAFALFIFDLPTSMSFSGQKLCARRNVARTD